MSSCFDDGNCTTDSTDLVHVSFRKFATQELDTVEIKNIQIAGLDSLFYENDTTTTITLPFSPSVESMTINLSFETSDKTLNLDYNVVPRLISADCGTELSYTNIEIATHDFDSAAVRQATLDKQILTEATLTNIVIYQ